MHVRRGEKSLRILPKSLLPRGQNCPSCQMFPSKLYTFLVWLENPACAELFSDGGSRCYTYPYENYFSVRANCHPWLFRHYPHPWGVAKRKPLVALMSIRYNLCFLIDQKTCSFYRRIKPTPSTNAYIRHVFWSIDDTYIQNKNTRQRPPKPGGRWRNFYILLSTSLSKQPLPRKLYKVNFTGQS
jgi:hypothetical protein